jgi:hypothetical protein
MHGDGEGARRELTPLGRQHLAAGVHQMDNGSLTIKGLVMGCRVLAINRIESLVENTMLGM